MLLEYPCREALHRSLDFWTAYTTRCIALCSAGAVQCAQQDRQASSLVPISGASLASTPAGTPRFLHPIADMCGHCWLSKAVLPAEHTFAAADVLI
jgi:hypothetical protein